MNVDKIKHNGKFWWCPKCKARHGILTTTSYRPKRCEKCRFQVWIFGKYIVDETTKYQHLVIDKFEEYKPKQKGG